jgi:hypothetical protein
MPVVIDFEAVGYVQTSDFRLRTRVTPLLLSRPFWCLKSGKANAGWREPFFVRRFCRIFPDYLAVVGFSLFSLSGRGQAWLICQVVGFTNLLSSEFCLAD